MTDELIAMLIALCFSINVALLICQFSPILVGCVVFTGCLFLLELVTLKK